MEADKIEKLWNNLKYWEGIVQQIESDIQINEGALQQRKNRLLQYKTDVLKARHLPEEEKKQSVSIINELEIKQLHFCVDITKDYVKKISKLKENISEKSIKLARLIKALEKNKCETKKLIKIIIDDPKQPSKDKQIDKWIVRIIKGEEYFSRDQLELRKEELRNEKKNIKKDIEIIQFELEKLKTIWISRLQYNRDHIETASDNNNPLNQKVISDDGTVINEYAKSLQHCDKAVSELEEKMAEVREKIYLQKSSQHDTVASMLQKNVYTEMNKETVNTKRTTIQAEAEQQETSELKTDNRCVII